MKKKSTKKAARGFNSAADEILAFLNTQSAQASDKHQSWLHDYAIIRLYRDFESLMLTALVAAINNDTSHLSQTAGVDLPKHLSQDVCYFLVLRGGYFDFRGRSGLIGDLKKMLPANHYLIDTVKKDTYKDALDRLSALRNFAAHDSQQSKAAALKAVGLERMSSAGAWLKKQDRFKNLVAKLKALATELENAAPY